MSHVSFVTKSFMCDDRDYGYFYKIFKIQNSNSDDPPPAAHNIFFRIKIQILYTLIQQRLQQLPDTAAPASAGASANDDSLNGGQEDYVQKIKGELTWTINASQRDLIWQLYFQIKYVAFIGIGIPADVANDLILDLFYFAKNINADDHIDYGANNKRQLSIFVSIKVATMQMEGETIDEVSRRTIAKPIPFKPPSIESIPIIKKLEPWIFEDYQMVEDCSICLDGKDSKVEGIRLRCNHMFHTSCMLRWIVKNRTCPLCRSSIYDNVVLKRNKGR